jgi:hypothetical protein
MRKKRGICENLDQLVETEPVHRINLQRGFENEARRVVVAAFKRCHACMIPTQRIRSVERKSLGKVSGMLSDRERNDTLE